MPSIDASATMRSAQVVKHYVVNQAREHGMRAFVAIQRIVGKEEAQTGMPSIDANATMRSKWAQALSRVSRAMIARKESLTGMPSIDAHATIWGISIRTRRSGVFILHANRSR